MASSKSEQDTQFSAFVAQATPSLMRTAWLITGSQDQAHELVQAALVKTYVAWRRVRPGEATAYARRVLVNHRTDVWRRTRRERLVDQTPDRPVEAATSTADDRDALVRLLATLPDQQRRVVVLRYYSDLSEQAVAEALGISVGAVKSAGSRGLATLRQAYADAAPEASTTEGAER